MAAPGTCALSGPPPPGPSAMGEGKSIYLLQDLSYIRSPSWAPSWGEMNREEGRTEGPRRQANATPVQARTRPTLGFRPRPAFSLQDEQEEPSTNSSKPMTLLWLVWLLIRTHLGKHHCVHLKAAARPPSVSWVGGPSGVVLLWVPGPPCPRESPTQPVPHVHGNSCAHRCKHTTGITRMCTHVSSHTHRRQPPAVHPPSPPQ